MIFFNNRVPNVITIDESSSQIATQVELFIWGLDETEPTTPTHVIQKETFSPTQFEGKYNISPFCYDAITRFKRVVFCKVKTYYKLTTDWIFIEELEHISAKGYEQSKPNFSGVQFLQSFTDNRYKFVDEFGDFTRNILTIDVLFDFDVYESLRVRYYSDLGEEFVTYTDTGIKLLTIPKSTPNNFFKDGNSYELQTFDGTNYNVVYVDSVITECEPKFKPYVLTYTNILGGNSQIYFFKKSTFAEDYKSNDYNLAGSKQVFNLNGTRTLKLNTGWLNENGVKAVKDMMLSEDKVIFAFDNSDNFYVTAKTTSFIEKTKLNDKVINYEIDFEIATPLIQNYV